MRVKSFDGFGCRIKNSFSGVTSKTAKGALSQSFQTLFPRVSPILKASARRMRSISEMAGLLASCAKTVAAVKRKSKMSANLIFIIFSCFLFPHRNFYVTIVVPFYLQRFFCIVDSFVVHVFSCPVIYDFKGMLVDVKNDDKAAAFTDLFADHSGNIKWNVFFFAGSKQLSFPLVFGITGAPR